MNKNYNYDESEQLPRIFGKNTKIQIIWWKSFESPKKKCIGLLEEK